MPPKKRTRQPATAGTSTQSKEVSPLPNSKRSTRFSSRIQNMGQSASTAIPVDDSDSDDGVVWQDPVGNGRVAEDDLMISDPLPQSSLAPPSPAESVIEGRPAWRKDFDECKLKWGVKGEIEGYVGMMAVIKNFKSGDGDDSVRLNVAYEDIEGRAQSLSFDLVFDELGSYPHRYQLLLFSEQTLSARANTSFTRFTSISNLSLDTLIVKIISSLQGDDEATGNNGIAITTERESTDDEMDLAMTDNEEDDDGFYDSVPGRGFEVAKGSGLDLGKSWGDLKEHFAQGVSFGYRPGLTQVSDFWVVSYSTPLKNMAISPNTLAMWDDGLVDAWRKDERFTLMMAVDTYPPRLDQIKYHLCLHPDYKPPEEVILASTRGQTPPFYLSAPLISLLKSFPLAYKIREAYGLPWAAGDKTGLDPELCHRALTLGEIPHSDGETEEDDPIAKGFGKNLELVAFHWVVRRFLEAAKYCLNCGLPVEIPSLRPYVCDKPLCLYGFMSLGLGPSVEHVIRTQPGVVDLLLSLTHAAASSHTRMDLPLHLHIMVPKEFGLDQPTLLDELEGDPAAPPIQTAPSHRIVSTPLAPQSNQRKALLYLIESLPKVSVIKTHLDEGHPLKRIPAPEGAIGVLRWVVGSCKAYLKQTKPGEGVLSNGSSSKVSGSSHVHYAGATGIENCRQFSFVVGSPEQENSFKEEVAIAQRKSTNCVKYPTLLAFHGSGTERWHNILRTGLDYVETANGRVSPLICGKADDQAYGHGVYFAAEATTSMGSYARAATTSRPNADFPVSTVTAVVELVNVPETFVSRNPYYVVSNTKQIKPFLLLVTGPKNEPLTAEAEGNLYQHDPGLSIKTTYGGKVLNVKMPEKLSKQLYTDTQPNDPLDTRISTFTPSTFTPSPQSRYDKIELLPPPRENSISATRLLGKELKGLIEVQERGGLPFWIDAETDILYRWILELYDFPESQLKKDLKKYNINSVITELRFPATYPHAPPFVRILHPRFLRFAEGGGGHITAGGSICHELLSTEKWNPAYSIEAVVRDIMVNMTDSSPPAKLDHRNWDKAYGMNEAIEAFKRVSAQHGWAVPKDFDKFAQVER